MYRGQVQYRLDFAFCQSHADVLASTFESMGWEVREPDDGLRSGVMLIKARGRVLAHLRCDEPLRKEASRLRVALSA